MCFADNPSLGTWKLDESKSEFGDGAGKPATVVWEKTGDKDKCTVDGVDAAGKKTHTVWTGKLDDLPSSSLVSYSIGGAQYVAVVVGLRNNHVGDLSRTYNAFRKRRGATDVTTPNGGAAVWVFGL